MKSHRVTRILCGLTTILCLSSGIPGVIVAQSPGVGQYRSHVLQHASPVEVRRMLRDMLGDLAAETEIIADTDSGKILLRGPDEAHTLAAQLIPSIDRPLRQEVDARPVLHAYPCDPARLSTTVADLHRQYGGDSNVRITVDPRTPQVIIVAPSAVHERLALQFGEQSPPAFVPARNDSYTARPADDSVVALRHITPDKLERLLVDVLGPRLKARPSQTPLFAEYSVFAADGRILADLHLDRRLVSLKVDSTSDSVKQQILQLVQALDTAPDPSGQKVRIMSVRRTNPAVMQQAIRAIQSDSSSHTSSAQKGSENSSASVEGLSHNGIELVNYLFQEEDASEASYPEANYPASALPGQVPPQDEDERTMRALRSRDLQDENGAPIDFGLNVQIQSLPDIDAIVVTGLQRDVEEVTQLLEEIERLSEETEPVVEVYPLKHVAGDSLMMIVQQVQTQLLSGTQGDASVLPLMKPNSLLIIGWGDAVEKVKDLISKLDRPVEPDTQFTRFPLKNTAPYMVYSTLQGFLSSRYGMATRVRVMPDNPTNSLLVYGPPRDIEEVGRLIELLDVDESEAVMQLRTMKLKNMLAQDIFQILNTALMTLRSGGVYGRSSVLEFFDSSREGQDMLRSGLLSNVFVTANTRTNTLIILGPEKSMALLEAVINHLDEPASTAQIKVFHISNGDAMVMKDMLRELLPTQTAGIFGPQLPGAVGEESFVPIRFTVDTRTNTIIVAGSEGHLLIIEALLTRLDEVDLQQRQPMVVRLKNVSAGDVAAAVNEYLRSQRIVHQGLEGIYRQVEAEVIVVAEPVSNSLIVSATTAYYDEIMDMITTLDAPTPQVVIQVLIAEVLIDNADEFGMELGIQDSMLFNRSMLGDLETITKVVTTSDQNGIVTLTEDVIVAATNTPGFLFNDQIDNMSLGNSGSQTAANGASTVAGQGLTNLGMGRINSELGYGGMVLSASSESVSLLIRALHQTGQLEILSRPQIMTLDNQSATMQVGKRVPRVVSSETSNLGGRTNEVDLEDIGLILGVTPRINEEEGIVVMEVNAEKSELGPRSEGIPISVSPGGQEVLSPTINIAKAETTVSARDGETIVLGGIITKNHEQIHRSVPLLSNIPILGHLFRYDFEQCTRAELLIILTPRIVRNAEDANRIKQIEASRMNFCLTDVTEMHGDIGVWDISGDVPVDGNIPAIYPEAIPGEELPNEPQWIPDSELAPPTRPNPTPAPLREDLTDSRASFRDQLFRNRARTEAGEDGSVVRHGPASDENPLRRLLEKREREKLAAREASSGGVTPAAYEETADRISADEQYGPATRIPAYSYEDEPGETRRLWTDDPAYISR